MPSIYDLLLEDEKSIEDMGVQQMRKVMDAVRTSIPSSIATVKSQFANSGEYELFEFLDNCEFWEVRNKNSPSWYQTAGVRATPDRIEFYYDKDFIEKISKKPNELVFLIAHEASHIFRYHIDRTKSQGHDGDLANVAQDMIINHDIVDLTPSVGGFKPELVEGGLMPSKEFHAQHKDKKDLYYYEYMYKWLQANPDEDPTKQPEESESQQEPQDYWKEGSICKVNSGDDEGEYVKITKVNKDGSVETEPVDLEKEYEKVRNGK